MFKNRLMINEAWIVHTTAILTALMGVTNVLSAVTPSLRARIQMIEAFAPLVVRQGSHLTAAIAGFALILVARNLWRRKRAAWVAAMVMLVLSAASHILKGFDYEEASLALALAVGLWIFRSSFHARSDAPSIKQGLRVLVFASLFTLGYGISGFFLLDRHYSVNFGLWSALRQTVAMFTQFYDPGLAPITRFGRFFADSIYAIGAITFGYASFMMVRPVLLRQPSTPEEREHARRIVEAYGRSSLARLALFDDKAYYFSQGGSLLAFTIKGRTAISLGDPIGPPEDTLAAIHSFVEYAKANDWLPVFFQTLPDTLEYYKAAGFEALCIGHEGIVDLASFTTQGRENKWLRTSRNRLEKQDYHALIHKPPLSDEMVEELHEVSNEWLTSMHGSEKRFSLGWFENEYIRYSIVATVHSPSGLIIAFTNIVPEYQLNEISIDLMRHRKEVEPGTMDYLFVSLIEWAKEQGFSTFNLGMSPLAGVGEHPNDPVIERSMHYVFQHINQFYNFKGLHGFKEKFHPTWSPRYLICPGMIDLGAAGVAVVQATSGNQAFPWGYFKRN
jgi:phosphatidylglycerol lysyltransferase